MKKTICIILVALLTVLSSCTIQNQTTDKDETTDFDMFKPQTADSILLVNRFSYRLVSYNTKALTAEATFNKTNSFVYEFDPGCKYYTAGNSFDLGFGIYELNDSSFKNVLSMKENEGIFPLAYTENHYYFIKCTYDSEYLETSRVLVEYIPSENTLVEFENINGLIKDGVVINDTLYFTEYNEHNVNYNLCSLLLSEKGTAPKKEKTLEFGELYTQNGELFTSDDEYISSETKKFKKASENYFIGSDLLLQYQIQGDSGLCAILIDTETGEQIYSAEAIVDFKCSDSAITFYCEGTIKTFDMVNRSEL